MSRDLPILSIVFLISLAATSCSPAISKQLREQVDKTIRFEEVAKNPEKYQGKIVLWGGSIVEAENQKSGTHIQVLQKPIDIESRPKETDRTEGRFLALYDGYLDVAVYAEGREVTVVGEIKGKKVLPLGEIEYAYPLISVKEIHIWPRRKEYRDRYWPRPWWGNYPPDYYGVYR